MHRKPERFDPVITGPYTILKKNSKLWSIFGLVEEEAFAYIIKVVLLYNSSKSFVQGVISFFLNHA